jgi:hypothetical protein
MQHSHNFYSVNAVAVTRWRMRLDKELSFRKEFEGLDTGAWRALLATRSVTSKNHDTVLSLDWPHYCVNATIACGGPEGWCYTFQGHQASKLHNRHAAMVDVLATREPVLFGEAVATEVRKLVENGSLPYPNIRFSGSGEVVDAYLPALQEIAKRDVRLWGFTRNLRLANRLREIGAFAIVSCDKTSPPGFVDQAKREALPLAYSSSGVEDEPPVGTLVTFPVHRVGRVREVVDTASLCPKVLADYFDDFRPEGYCQRFCQRCHLGGAKP